MANKSNRASAAARRLAERRNRQEQEQKQDKKVSPTAADIPDSRNRLLSTTAKRSPHDYAQLRAMSVTTVQLPGDIYEAMQEIKAETGVAPGRQLLNALRVDPQGGEIYTPDKHAPIVRKGAKSILNPQRVQIRIPTEEFLNVREMSFRKNISVTQMFTNAWKRQHKWRTKKQED